MFVAAWRPNCGGQGVPQRATTSSRSPSAPTGKQIQTGNRQKRRNVCPCPSEATYLRGHTSCSSIPLEVNMALTNFKLLICLLMLSEFTLAQAKCLRTVSEIKANNVKARWQETTENDGKPLTISITDGANGLVYSAKKAGVLWLTGNVSVCLSGGATEISLKNTQATSNVPMLARMALPSTQSAQIVNNQIKLGGGGWGGTFIGQ